LSGFFFIFVLIKKFL